MNEFKAYPYKTLNGWLGMVRFAHNGKSNPILGKGGYPKSFKTREAALDALLEHMLGYFNGDYQAYDNLSVKDMKRQAAEALFKTEGKNP